MERKQEEKNLYIAIYELNNEVFYVELMESAL